MRSRLTLHAFLTGFAFVLIACTSGAATAPTISDAWARASVGSDKPTAAYLVITNPSAQADALVGASSPAAASVQIHETSTDTSGMTGMHPVDRIDVPGGATVRLEPGGLHLMLMGLTGPFEAGETVEIDLVFERAGTIAVEAVVREG